MLDWGRYPCTVAVPTDIGYVSLIMLLLRFASIADTYATATLDYGDKLPMIPNEDIWLFLLSEILNIGKILAI